MNDMGKFKVSFTAVTAFLSSLLGILYIPVLLMVSCNTIDYVTGLMASPKRGQEIKSKVLLQGITKKVCMWLLVVVGAIIDRLIMYSAETVGMKPVVSYLVACVVCMWIICSELISILENMIDIGVNLPPFLLPLVKLMRKQAEDAGRLAGEGRGDGNPETDK